MPALRILILFPFVLLFLIFVLMTGEQKYHVRAFNMIGAAVNSKEDKVLALPKDCYCKGVSVPQNVYSARGYCKRVANQHVVFVPPKIADWF